MVGWNVWLLVRIVVNYKGKWGQCIRVNDREEDRCREGNEGDLFFILIIEKIYVFSIWEYQVCEYMII